MFRLYLDEHEKDGHVMSYIDILRAPASGYFVELTFLSYIIVKWTKICFSFKIPHLSFFGMKTGLSKNNYNTLKVAISCRNAWDSQNHAEIDNGKVIAVFQVRNSKQEFANKGTNCGKMDAIQIFRHEEMHFTFSTLNEL